MAVFRLAIGDVVGNQITLLPFLLSVAIAARYGGLGPGLIATVLGAFVSVTLFIEPTNVVFLGGATDRIRLCVYLLIGGTISYLYAALITARARAEVSASEAIDKQRMLEVADRNKNEFLATLAHEMRNPLAVLQNEIAVMRLGGAPASHQSSLDLLHRQTYALTSLTADLFDLSAIGRGKLRLTMKPVDLKQAARSAIETVRPALESHQHTVATDLTEEPLLVVGDEARLTQVFVNLLANSIKYTDSGGNIRVSGGVDGRYALVRVSDNGVGISAEHLPRLFELGEQVEKDIERSDGGLGIGLAVVRRLVTMHGGSVDVASDGPGCGCTFSVRLPIAKQNEKVAGCADLREGIGKQQCNPHRSSSSLGPPRILVVDDHGSIAKTCAAILQGYGYEAVFATTGVSAIQLAQDFKPHIALIDINMPQMNGYELAQRIKDMMHGENVTLVAMSGAEGERETQRCLDAGYACCLVKPVSMDDLRRIASDWVESSAHQVADAL